MKTIKNNSIKQLTDRFGKNIKVYVASPLSPVDNETIAGNMNNAKFCCKVVEDYNNEDITFRTFAPHAYLPEFLDDNIAEEREIALKFGAEVLNLCDCIAVFLRNGNIISKGMQEEIKIASKKNMPVLIFADRNKDIDFNKTYVKIAFQNIFSFCVDNNIINNIYIIK